MIDDGGRREGVQGERTWRKKKEGRGEKEGGKGGTVQNRPKFC